MPEFDPRKFDHVDLDALGRQVVEQRLQHHHRLVMMKKRGVQQVDPGNLQRLLLQAVFVVEHAHVQQDLAVFVARVRLEFDAHPAVAFVGAVKIARRYGVGERKKSGAVAACRPQPL